MMTPVWFCCARAPKDSSAIEVIYIIIIKIFDLDGLYKSDIRLTRTS